MTNEVTAPDALTVEQIERQQSLMRDNGGCHGLDREIVAKCLVVAKHALIESEPATSSKKPEALPPADASDPDFESTGKRRR